MFGDQFLCSITVVPASHILFVRFNVIRFSSEAETWHDRLVEPTEAACQSAVRFVSQLKAEGGTDTLQALEVWTPFALSASSQSNKL